MHFFALEKVHLFFRVLHNKNTCQRLVSAKTEKEENVEMAVIVLYISIYGRKLFDFCGFLRGVFFGRGTSTQTIVVNETLLKNESFLAVARRLRKNSKTDMQTKHYYKNVA